MAYTTLVNVFDARNELLIHSDSCLLMQSLMGHNIVEELAVLAELHDEKQFTFSFNDFKQLNYIGVPDFLQYFDLSAYSLNVLFVFYP